MNPDSTLASYLRTVCPDADLSGVSAETLAFAAAMDVVGEVAPEIASAVAAELADQRANLKLIASENFASPATLLAMGNWLSDKYAEGSPGHRFYAGCENVDTIERRAVELATGLLDYDQVRKQAESFRPLVLLAGYSSYPRKINFRIFREIADEVGAVLMVDMAHFAGLVAGKVFSGDFDPVAHAQVVTTTTHKTLRGPRGGMVLCTEEFAATVDRGCPLVLGGPLGHIMAAKAVALTEASRPEFAGYAQRIVDNAAALADALQGQGATVITGGTDNHLLLVDARPYGLTGRQAETALREAGITLNRNVIPFDPNGSWYTSGLRLGTPAVTTLGMGADEMREVAAVVHAVLDATQPVPDSKAKYELDAGVRDQAKARAGDLLDRFPLYPGIAL
jgi:glycine hydroxymethyltransferase